MVPRSLGTRAVVLFLFYQGTMHLLTVQGLNVALPSIRDEFDVGLATVVSVQLAYALGLAGTAITVGRLSKMLNQRLLMLVGQVVDLCLMLLIIFTANIYLIVGARFLHAVFRLFPWLVLQILAVGSYPRERRGKIVGLIKLVQGLAIMLSVPLAGYVTEEWGWRWLFVAAVVANATLTIFIWFLIPSNAERRSPNSIKNFDLLGSGMLMAFMIATLTSIQFFIKGYDLGVSLLLAGLACVTLIGFVRVERRADEPIVHFSLFRIPGVCISAAQAIFLGFVDGALFMLLPFLFIKGYGWSVAYAGSILFLLHVARPPAAALAGWVSDRYGSARIIASAVMVSLAAQAGMSLFSYPPSVEMVSVCLVLIGLSQAVMVVANLRQIFSVLPSEHVEMAPVLNLVLMQVGTATGQTFSAALGMAGTPSGALSLANMAGISQAPLAILLVAVIFAAGMSVAHILPRFFPAELCTLTERRAT